MSLSKPIIWIVEDDPSTQRLMVAHLQTHGFEPVCLDTAEKAYAALREGGVPSLMLVDVMLPGMSGVDLIRLIKQNPEWEKIPVVVVTALSRNDTLTTGSDVAKQAPCWVNKPFDANDLVQTIQQILAAVK